MASRAVPAAGSLTPLAVLVPILATVAAAWTFTTSPPLGVLGIVSGAHGICET